MRIRISSMIRRDDTGRTFLTRAVAVSLCASLIVTMPGTTGWAGTNQPTVTQTSKSKPNDYNSPGSNKLTALENAVQTTLQIATGLNTIMGRGLNAYQQMAGSGMIDHNINMSVSNQPSLGYGQHLATLDNRQQVALDPGQILFHN